ncbi:MAG: beta-lactamase family protein [Deltaproteobacteria bacterium]|nr:beta-lactamase family protein [Deltaproteobacteria bacterium]
MLQTAVLCGLICVGVGCRPSLGADAAAPTRAGEAEPEPEPDSSVSAPVSSTAERLDAVVTAWHDAGLFSGVVLVADEGEVVWQGAVGLAEVATARPNTVDTVFPIASLTKQLTAVLVMQQVEQGTLQLDTTIAEVLPWYRRDTGERITVAHLLRHVSGLPDIDPAVYMQPDPRAAQARWLLDNHGSGDLRFEPGTNFGYTNTDYHVLTAMLEEVTGLGYEQLLAERILEPLGMQDSGIARRDSDRRGWAVDYVPTEDGWIVAPAFRWENWQGAGAMRSTLADLHRWNQALSSNQLVSAETWKTMLTPLTDLPGGGNYVGLGSWVYPRALPGSELAPRLVERRGAIGGYTIVNVLVADEDRWIVLLSNRYDEGMHTLPYASCLPLDLLLVLYGLEPQGPPAPAEP